MLKKIGLAPAPGLERIAGAVRAEGAAAVRRRRQEPPERVAATGPDKPDMSGKPDKRPKK